MTLSTFPPLYVFAFLYYPDTLSVTFTLAMLYFNLKGEHWRASFAGKWFDSVYIRRRKSIILSFSLQAH